LDTDPYPLANIFCFVSLPLTIECAVFVVAVLLLLVISALASACETAYYSLSQDEKNILKDNGVPREKRMAGTLQAPEKLLATTLVTTAFLNIAIAVIAFCGMNVVAGYGYSGMGCYFLQGLAVFSGLLVFGKIIPKMYASRHALKVFRRTAGMISLFQKIFYPFITALVSSSAFIHTRVQKNRSISIDDLSNALENSAEVIPENENILKGIVKFGNIDAHTIMTPRMDVESVEIGTSLSELFAVIKESGYSRIPVYDDTPDNITGILYIKDLLPYIDETDEFEWQKLIRDAYFVPENKKIDDLLKKFQETKIHLAVIIDEYGGMVGIVTLEDVLEEIVGDIADESDDDEPGYVQVDEKTYLFDGKVLLNDFYRILHLDDTVFDDIRGDADTLAGIILELKAEIPAQGDCVDYKNFSFSVEAVDNRRIKQIKVIVNESEK
jgi:gliding motility-associated protein GldE